MGINTIIYIIAFAFGTLIGSFLNVIIYRLKINKNGKASINLGGRSKCPKCNKTLTWFELIPLLSYLVLRGKCNRCKKKISWQYPLVELAAGVLTFAPMFYLGLKNPYAYIIILVFYLLVVVFFYDLENLIVPDIVLLPLFCLIIIFDIIKIARNDISPLNLVCGVLIGGGFFLILVIISKEKWMGWGDVKLGFLLGLLLAYPYIIVSYAIAFILGALVSLMLISFKGLKLKSEVPFAPYLIIGTAITLFWGQEIINWYLRGF